MALHDDNYTEGMYYINIIDGKLAVHAKESDNGAVSRVNKNGKTVWEIYKKSIDGNIIDIKMEDTDYGQMCNLILQDVDEKYKLTLPVKSNYFAALAKKQEYIDVNEKVMITPFSFKDKNDPNKTIAGLNISQDGEKVENYITKDNPLDGPTLSPNAKSDEKDQFKLDIVKFYKRQVDKLMDRVKAKQASEPYKETVRTTTHAEAEANRKMDNREEETPDAGIEDFEDMPWDNQF